MVHINLSFIHASLSTICLVDGGFYVLNVFKFFLSEWSIMFWHTYLCGSLVYQGNIIHMGLFLGSVECAEDQMGQENIFFIKFWRNHRCNYRQVNVIIVMLCLVVAYKCYIKRGTRIPCSYEVKSAFHI